MAEFILKHHYPSTRLFGEAIQKPAPVIPTSELSQFAIGRIVPELYSNNPVFIHLAGTSGSGKTECSKSLARKLKPYGSVTVLDMDRFLADSSAPIDHTPPDPSMPYLCGFNPLSFNLEEVKDVLDSMRQGNRVSVPIYDRTTHKRIDYEHCAPSKFVIVEGMHALDADIATGASLTCLVSADFHTRLMRRAMRVLRVFGRKKELDKLITQYINSIEPGYQHHLLQLKAAADVIVDNNKQNGSLNLSPLPPEPIDGDCCQSLIPLPQYGTLKPLEYLTLTESTQGDKSVRYYDNGSKLFEGVVDNNTVELLRSFYRFR